MPTRVEATDEDGIHLRRCLNALSPEERELLMLAGWEGLSAAEIGRVLGCSPTAARIRLHRARGRLKVEIDGSAVPEKQKGAAGHIQEGSSDKSPASEEVLEP